MKKLIALAIVLIASMVVIPLSDSGVADAEESETMTLPLYGNCHGSYYRSHHMLEYHSSGEGRYYFDYPDKVFYTETEADGEFSRYMFGDSHAMDDKMVVSPVEGESYYLYIETNYPTFTKDSQTEYYEYSGDFIKMVPEYRCIELMAGTYTIEVNGAYDEYDLMPIADDYGYRMDNGKSNSLTIFQSGSYYLISYYCQGIESVEFTISGEAPPSPHVPGSGSSDAVCGVDKVWKKCVVEGFSGYVRDCFVFEKGGPDDLRFFEEVAGRDITVFNPDDYNPISAYEELVSSKVYSVYMLTGSSSLRVNDSESGDAVTFDLDEVVEPVSYSFYVEAYSDYSVAVTYDSSVFRLFRESSNGDYYYLESDVEYDLFNGMPSTYTITAKRLMPESIGGASQAEFKITLEGNSLPSDDADVVAGVMILVCMALFAILGFSGLKPRWSKK